MNLEHTRMIPATDLERLTASQLMVHFVDRESVLKCATVRLRQHAVTATIANDEGALNEYAHALLAVDKEFAEAKRWADHYRAVVRQELRETTCSNDEVQA